MLRRLVKEDIEKIMNLYFKEKLLDETKINDLANTIDISKIIVGNIENDEITSLISASLIKNEYYIEDLVSITKNRYEIDELIKFLINELKIDERGLNIYYDNFPYSEDINSYLIQAGFKTNNIVYTYDNKEQIEPISSDISINDTLDDVYEFANNNYKKIMFDLNKYNNTPLSLVDELHLENTNIIVSRISGHVNGVLRYSLIDQKIIISNIYATGEDIYKNLINALNSITEKPLEISVHPIRVDLMNTLSSIGFIKTHSDYIYNLSS